MTKEKVVNAHDHAKNAAAQSHAVDENALCRYDIENEEMKYGGSDADRRGTIKFPYIHVFGASAEDTWHELRLIPTISFLLTIPSNSHTAVGKILLAIVEEQGKYDGPAVVLNAGELAEAAEIVEEGMEGLGEGENDPEASDSDEDD